MVEAVLFSDTQSCLILCDPMDCSLPGSSVHGIFQARILKRVAISFSRGSSQSTDQTCVSFISCINSIFFTTEPPGKPAYMIQWLISKIHNIYNSIVKKKQPNNLIKNGKRNQINISPMKTYKLPIGI